MTVTETHDGDEAEAIVTSLTRLANRLNRRERLDDIGPEEICQDLDWATRFLAHIYDLGDA
jgi:hypothetical protein